MRVLLTEWEPRPLDDLLSFAREHGRELRLAAGDAEDPSWRTAEVLSPESRVPIELEVALSDDDLLRDEVTEFREALQEADARRRVKRRVDEHLGNTEAIVAIRVLASDMDAGREGAQTVLAYFAQRDGVLFQADGEGFYEGEKLIVRTA